MPTGRQLLVFGQSDHQRLPHNLGRGVARDLEEVPKMNMIMQVIDPADPEGAPCRGGVAESA